MKMRNVNNKERMNNKYCKSIKNYKEQKKKSENPKKKFREIFWKKIKMLKNRNFNLQN